MRGKKWNFWHVDSQKLSLKLSQLIPSLNFILSHTSPFCTLQTTTCRYTRWNIGSTLVFLSTFSWYTSIACCNHSSLYQRTLYKVHHYYFLSFHFSSLSSTPKIYIFFSNFPLSLSILHLSTQQAHPKSGCQFTTPTNFNESKLK